MSADRIDKILRDFKGYNEASGVRPPTPHDPAPPARVGRQYPAYRKWRGEWVPRMLPPSGGGVAGRNRGGGLGTELRPRASTHPAVDGAAQSVADAILGEPGNQRAFHRSLEMYVLRFAVGASGARCAVAGGTPVAMAHEWDVPRILNDRVWDWMKYVAFEARPAAPTKNGHALPRGRLDIDLYHRCHGGCSEEVTNLLSAEARPRTRYALVGCPAAGVVHLCRARADSCPSLQETQDTQLVCQVSGRVCMEAGVAASQEIGDVSQERNMRSVEYGLGGGGGEASEAAPMGGVDCGSEEAGGCADDNDDDNGGGGAPLGETAVQDESVSEQRAVDMLCRRGRPDVHDPENARRARAIDAMYRAGCPQIIEWDRDMGRLVLDLRASPGVGEVHFDPTFFWAAADAGAEARAEAPDAPPAMTERAHNATTTTTTTPLQNGWCEGGGAPVPRSAFQRTAVASMARMESERRAKRSVRAKRARESHRRFGRPGAGLVDQEREEIESVLDDLLWDAETRVRVNAENAGEARRAAEAAIAERMEERSVPDLFLSVLVGTGGAASGGGGAAGGGGRRVLSAGAVQESALHAVRHRLVPVVPFSARVHDALVHTILYLWDFVVHMPLDGAGGERGGAPSQQRVRRNTDVRSVNLSQFVLGFLYTAADSGVQVANLGGWPRDWWLKDHLPDVKVIDRFGSGRGASRVRIMRENKRRGPAVRGGDRAMATWGSEATARDLGAEGNARAVGSAGTGVSAGTGGGGEQRGVAVRIYQAHTVTMGKRCVSKAVCQYGGGLPTHRAVCEVLQKDFTSAYMDMGPRSIGQDFRPSSPSPSPSPVIATTHDPFLREPRRTTEMQPFSHAIWQRQRQHITTTTTTTTTNGTSGMSNGEGTHLCFSCMYVLGGSRAHICVTYDPYDREGPPGLEWGSWASPPDPSSPRADEADLDMLVVEDANRVPLHEPTPPVDTVVGPFVRQEDARKFCIEWGKGLRSLDDRRQFGISLAQRLGLRVWHTPPPSSRIRSSRAEYTFPYQHQDRVEAEAESRSLAPSRRSAKHRQQQQQLAVFRSLVRGGDGWGARTEPIPADLGATKPSSAMMDLSA